MKKTFRWSIPVFIATIIVVVLALTWLGYGTVKAIIGRKPEIDLRMFEQIEELEKLDPYITKELKFGDDRYARKLEIEESYLCKVKYNDCYYEVYAYVFKDDANARKYFQNITGNKPDLAASFCASTNWITYADYIAYRNNCALYVNGKNYEETMAFINWLNSDFSKGLFE